MAATMSPTHSPYAHSQSRPQRSTPTARSTARTPAPVGQTLSPNASMNARTPSDRIIKETKNQSPSYFGLSLDPAQDNYGSNEATNQVRSNWSPPSSNVRSTAAASPRTLPLDQNPEFAAFRKASESSKFTFSSNNLPRPFGSLSGISNSTRSSTDSGRTGTSAELVMSREHSSAGAIASADEKNIHQRSPKRLLSSPVGNITDRPRRNSPASFDDRHEEIARQVARFVDDDRQANQSVPPHQSLPPIPKNLARSLSHHRAETLPDRFDGEDSQDHPRLDGPMIVTPQHVVGLLDASNEDILLLDLRVSTQYARSRITGALNLCIPTTLLKRPSFNAQKLSETFKDAEQRSLFERWRSSRYIIVYDASTSQMKDAATCVNTLKKFASEGWKGYSYIIRGGFQEFSAKFPTLVAAADDNAVSHTGIALKLDGNRPAVAPVVGGCPMPTTKTAANPFFGNIRQNMDLIGGVGQMAVKHPANLTQRMEESLPEWIRTAADPQDNGKMVADKFLGIEKREQKRMQEALSGTVSYASPGASARSPRSPLSPTGIRRRPDGGKVQIAGIEKGNKNRYNNIWPYEHSRVKIQGVPHGECDYVNANHIKASLSGKRYIATQGPIPATFGDFWNVVWQQDVRVIVMLTAEKEGGQVKAHKYWESGRHGNLNLNYLSEHRASLEPERIHRHYSKDHKDRVKDHQFKLGQRRATVTANPSAQKDLPSPLPPGGNNEQPYVIVRRFTLSRSDRPFERMREVTQLQYSSWPDFGAPAHPAHLLGLVEQCDAVVRQSQGGSAATATPGERDRAEQRPILVHCSAGCGRTGTFCTVDSVVDMLKRQRARRERREREQRKEQQRAAAATQQHLGGRGVREATPMDLDSASFSLSPSPQMAGARMSIDVDDKAAPFFPASPRAGVAPSPSPSFSFFPPAPLPATPRPKSGGEEEWLEREDVDLIQRTVEEFRLQRLSMVQSLRQYVLCYESVLEWLAEQMPKTA